MSLTAFTANTHKAVGSIVALEQNVLLCEGILYKHSFHTTIFVVRNHFSLACHGGMQRHHKETFEPSLNICCPGWHGLNTA